MTPEQANALLTLISDLARIIYSAPPPVEPEPSANGATTRESVTTP